jgi:hypothetical protein
MLTFSVFYVDVSADPPTEAEGGRNWLTERETVSCGSVTNIPARIPAVTSTFINVIQVLVPVLLVIFGIVDLTKAISSQKEDDITTGRKTLIKRIIIGFLVFLIIALTKLLLNFAVENTALRGSIIECVDCFISGNCQGG